jgi:hypothetical protein
MEGTDSRMFREGGLKMRERYRRTFATAILAGGIAIASASNAGAQVRIQGSVPLPTGRISVSIGDPAFRVGGIVPYDYDIYQHPDYGYGFVYHSRWIPVRQDGARWVVSDRPNRVVRRRDDWRYARVYRRADERRRLEDRRDRRDRRDDHRDERHDR